MATMKRSKLILGILGGFASCSYAATVDMYGLIDIGALYNTDASGHALFRLAPNNLQGNRVGFRGSETLGGGTSVLFVLENGFNMNNGTAGQGGALFGRQVYVGLKGTPGTLTVGRQYDILTTFVAGFNSAISRYSGGMGQINSVYGAHPADLDNLNSTKRVNNSIKYVSGAVNGLSVGAMLGLGESPAGFSKSRVWSTGAGYANGPLHLGAGITVAQDPNFSYWGTLPSSNTEASANALNLPGPIARGYASARTQQITAAGGAYNIGKATLGAVYSNVKFKDLGYETAKGLNPRGFSQGTASFETVEVNYAYKVSPALLVGIAYHYTVGTDPIDPQNARYKQFNAGADYALSKRTDIYAVVVSQRASGNDSIGAPAAAAIASLNAASGPKQTAVMLGIRHRF
jgi:predicted porin